MSAKDSILNEIKQHINNAADCAEKLIALEDESKNKAMSMLRTAQRLCREGLPSFANVKIEEALKLL
jgi:hypothetical protein